VVKYAKHKKTDTALAVKIIDKKKFWGRKNSTRHLKREIAIMSSIKHVGLPFLVFFFPFLFFSLIIASSPPAQHHSSLRRN